MLFLSAVLFLSAMLMTQAQKDLSENLKKEPLSEVLYIYDVTSDAPIDDLKGALASMTLRYSFKVIGERRYIFVAAGTSAQAVNQVDFPQGSMVIQYPAQHASDFYKMFGITSGWEDSDDPNKFGNEVLSMLEITICIPATMTLAEYSSEMVTFSKLSANVYGMITDVSYAVVSAYPPKIFSMAKVESNALQLINSGLMDTFGGPGNVNIQPKYVLAI